MCNMEPLTSKQLCYFEKGQCMVDKDFRFTFNYFNHPRQNRTVTAPAIYSTWNQR